MRKILLLIAFFIVSFLQAQKGKDKDTIGAMIKEKLEVFDADGKPQFLRIPDKSYYVMVYRFKGTDSRKVETIDSVRALEKKIVDIMLGGMIGDLKVICLSYGFGHISTPG